MYTRDIEYTDWDGEPKNEKFRFNITQTELLELETMFPGGLQKYMTDIAEKGDGGKIVRFVETMITKSYGEKDPDGRRFRKNPDIIQAFKETQAYDELFSELTLNTDKLVEFIQNIMPDDATIQKRLDKAGVPADILNQNRPTMQVVDTTAKEIEG